MIHPSYNELHDVIIKDRETDDPFLSSRYAVCTATAKRAEQLIRHQESLSDVKNGKPLSIAIDEIFTGKVQVLTEEEAERAKEESLMGEDSED